MSEPELRILLLEDAAEDVALIERCLRKANLSFSIRIEQTRTGLLDALATYQPDLILSDYAMPQFTALDALQLLREQQRKPPLILVTGSNSDEIAAACMREGADDYILKDNLLRLPAAIANALGKHAAERERALAITALKESEARLRQKEASLREAQRVGQVGSWELDLGTGSLTWSEETYRIFGRSPDKFEVNRDRFLECLHPADREPTRRAVAEALEQKKPYRVEHRILRPDGSQRWVLTQAELVLGTNGEPVGMFGTTHDLTERRELQEQFYQSQKMEAIGLLAGGVAHDFNNLLTVIRGQTEMVLADEKLSPEGVESLKQVVGAAERAANLTNQLLTFSRKQPAHLRPLDLNIVIKDLTKMLRRIIGEDIDLQVRPAPRLPSTNADPGMIEQVLMNCAVNARDAMPRGGQLIISTEAVNVDAEIMAQNAKAQTGRHVRLTIQDTGTGIDPAVLPRVFEPFFTTKRLGKGTGLGLATVYGIVEQHHGWIDVQTSLGQGTSFSIYLPAPADLEKSTPERAAIAQVRGGAEKILLVEDDAELRQCIDVMLQRLGYEVDAATTGLEAMRIWEEKSACFDLLLTDAVMPSGFGGWDLARELRTRKAQLRVIIVSGYNHESGGQEADDRIQFLAKPFTSQALADAIRKCLDAP
jgi:two-component system, cell cycle sensor histidine kinase and response regulator CckA